MGSVLWREHGCTFGYILGRTATGPQFFFGWFSMKTCGNFIEVLQTREVGERPWLRDEAVGGFVSQDY